MSGHECQLTCCDSECAMVNHCVVGGVRCVECGLWFCADEIGEDGLCARCAREAEEATEEEEEEEEDDE